MRTFMRIVIGPIYQANRVWMRMVMRIKQFFKSSGKGLAAQVLRVFRDQQHTRRVAFVCAPEVRGVGWVLGVVDFGVMVGGFGAVGGWLEGGKWEGKREKWRGKKKGKRGKNGKEKREKGGRERWGKGRFWG